MYFIVIEYMIFNQRAAPNLGRDFKDVRTFSTNVLPLIGARISKRVRTFYQRTAPNLGRDFKEATYFFYQRSTPNRGRDFINTTFTVR